MKKMLLLAVLAFGLKAHAQSCSNFYMLQNNKTIEMDMFDKKDKPSGKIIYTISNVQKSGGTLSSTVNSEIFMENGKTMGKSMVNMKCNGGVYMMDMKTFIPQQQTQQTQNIDTKSDFYLEYPSNMAVGDMLKDGAFTMDMASNGTNMEMNITNRKVEAQEDITTPAGTWKCFKITFHTKMKTKVAGIGIPFNMDETEWYAPNFGVVRTTTKISRTEIVSIK